jgi:hypothetical protein
VEPPRPAGRREAASERAQRVATVARRSGAELAGIAREVVRIPAALYMRAAEWLGARVLRAWLYVWPWLVRGWRLAGRALEVTQRGLTPARATIAVALLTAIALGASQWADLRAISVGTDNYAGLEDVVDPPPVSVKTVGSVHAWVGLPLALLAGVITVVSARGRPKAARLLAPLGAAVVAISLLIDRPAGLDEGNSALAYTSVNAELLPGFWAQLVSGAVLILIGPMLVHFLESGRERSARRSSPPAKPIRERRRFRLGRVDRAAEAGR